jgi:acyl-CoA synthetase (AMP-forming)/AMP-acid ligase II
MCTDGLNPSLAEQWRERSVDSDGLAFLQYTSGSTANPKGVMVKHHNLMHNLRVMETPVGPGPWRGLSWLPMYHDMGLVGGVLLVISCGVSCVLMSPLAFLQKPVRWLRAISNYGVTTSAGPSFAYELAADRISAEEKEGLDLSKWSIAVVGGEPINPRALERFSAAFMPCGFRPEALVPCYGLAEATLLVTRPVAGRPPRVREVTVAGSGQAKPLGRSLVGCGRTWLDMQLVIADPETMTPCPPGTVGEVWVSGLSVAAGYWGRPQETEQSFRAYLADSGTGPFLRTGDLGFIGDGELFLTGRRKDLLIIRGRNHYPEDIELTVQAAHAGLRTGCGAAFETWQDGQPLLVVVQEVEKSQRNLDLDQLLGDIRQTVAERHGLHVHDLVLLQSGSIPKTSSGKIQRHRCRLGYEQGTLKRWKAPTPSPKR